ncbi:hypothetical protein [Parasphingopyxis sp.]|uniref:hypothetical protein n=1 Tax=Parasphingopyxis sp. TaxID=1920299 RepID=UPI00260CF9C0|nr:hypothetical protein [Parasphingopyxis sp.]
MKKAISPLAVAPLAALIALAGCSEPEPEVVGEMSDPEAEEIEELTPEELPPMRTREASFRCDDNSVVYVSFYTNDSQVGVAMEQDAVQTILPNEAMAEPAEGEEAAEPAATPTYSGEGYTLVGASDAASIQFARAGGGLQTCDS